MRTGSALHGCRKSMRVEFELSSFGHLWKISSEVGESRLSLVTLAQSSESFTFGKSRATKAATADLGMFTRPPQTELFSPNAQQPPRKTHLKICNCVGRSALERTTHLMEVEMFGGAESASLKAELDGAQKVGVASVALLVEREQRGVWLNDDVVSNY